MELTVINVVDAPLMRLTEALHFYCFIELDNYQPQVNCCGVMCFSLKADTAPLWTQLVNVCIYIYIKQTITAVFPNL